RQGRLLPSGVPERIGHPDVRRTAAEDADSAANQGGLIAAYVVVETQAWRPQDVAARERTRVDVQDGRVERRVERRLVHRGNVRSQARRDRTFPRWTSRRSTRRSTRPS